MEPNEIGCIVGADFADPFGIDGLYLGFEYSAITNRTYKTPNPYEFYLHRNVPIGYPLGSDLDRANLRLKKYISKNWQFAFEFDYIRRGGGEMNVPWDAPWFDYTVEQGYDEPFPTGKVKYTRNLGFEIRWQPSYRRYVYTSCYFESITNLEHTDENRKDLIFTLGFWLDFRWKV